jgi:phosphoribosylformimino-5-aminoimidazole carboxamide ribotide isomerase
MAAGPVVRVVPVESVAPMTELFPAIDLRGGRCVRLLQGDYERETTYGDDPLAVATGFIDAGAAWLHVVDLDAARGEGPVNRGVVTAMASLAADRNVRLQTGGGVRTVDDARALFDAGVSRVVVGTAAVRDPHVVAKMSALGTGAVAVGLDVHLSTDDSGKERFEVAVQGWTQSSGLDMFDVLHRLETSGASGVVATDISRDGMLTGPSIELYEALRSSKLGVIASGGVSSLHDLQTLCDLAFLEGIIAGKAIYEGRIDVAESVALCRSGKRA